MGISITWIPWSLAVGGMLFVGFAVYFLWRIALIGAAYKAKTLCSSVFISRRDPESVLSQDLLVDGLSRLKYIDADIDYEEQSVTAKILVLAKRKAIFRPGLGCTLVIDSSEEEIRSQANPLGGFLHPIRQEQPWPAGELVVTEKLPPEVDVSRLREAVDEAFSEPDPDQPRRTRAVVVVYKGRIIAERYAEGFSHETSLIGWSMTKSVINALTGILVREGKLAIHDQTLLAEWRDPGDPRSDITLDQLLRMTSGLEFAEDYSNPLKDVVFMLLGTGDMGAYAASKPLQAKPNSRWHYSSGNTNIIARIIRDAIGGTDADYFALPRRALFDRIGMHSAVIEPDARGTFVGSSFMYATARDWARFGLLYLQDGVWKGERILPEGWVEYSVRPTSQSPEGEYGAHFWLQVPLSVKNEAIPTPSLPPDMYTAAGHEGQFVTIIPSRKLVVVRLGLSRLPGSWDHGPFLAGILEAISD
jgi:CubicO group peptidase (beta-lactamase class C family)